MKKLITVILTTSLLLGLTACDNQAEKQKKAEKESVDKLLGR